MDKEKIKLKIRALLEKTEDNGATKFEMESALQKATELMQQYFISEHEIKDPYIKELCVLKEVPLIKSGYHMTLFFHYLCDLFDCQHYYNKHRIVFFGFQQDTELCAYFYNTIIKTCLNEKSNFIKSSEYLELKKGYNGRSLASSFIKGFLIQVSYKMLKLYEDRESSLNESFALVLVDKKNKVKSQFMERNTKIKIKKSADLIIEEKSFLVGKEKGNKINIIQGVESSKKESVLMLQ